MANIIGRKNFPDVSVLTYNDAGSGVTTIKIYTIKNKKNEEEVKDRLRVMCLKHDLRYEYYENTLKEHCVLCSLKRFDKLRDLMDYIIIKANKGEYLFRLKNNLALVKIGEKTFVYRITSTK